jgi:hypothetical protein
MSGCKKEASPPSKMIEGGMKNPAVYIVMKDGLLRAEIPVSLMLPVTA